MTRNPAPLPAALRHRLDNMFGIGKPSQAEILVNHGLVATRAELAPLHVRGPARECFANASQAVMRLLGEPGDWRYCEGYAWTPEHDLLFEHAWLIDSSGRVWETTWPSTDDVVYLGLPFTPRELWDALGEAEGSPLFGDWARGFPLLKSHQKCCPGRARVSTPVDATNASQRAMPGQPNPRPR